MKETTAQDASGSMIAPWDDLRVDVVFNAGETKRSCGTSRFGIGCLVERPEPCTSQEAVDAAGPVDAQNAPTGPWKTADGFPQAPTAIIVSLIRENHKAGIRHGPRPAHDNYRVPLRSPAALPLLTLRRQK